jgi:hypothetical protein
LRISFWKWTILVRMHDKIKEAVSKVIFSHPELDSGSVKLLNPKLLDSDPDIHPDRMTDEFVF